MTGVPFLVANLVANVGIVGDWRGRNSRIAHYTAIVVAYLPRAASLISRPSASSVSTHNAPSGPWPTQRIICF